VVNSAFVAPLTGEVVMPLTPWYHWNANPIPEAPTDSVVVPPLPIVTDPGCEVITGVGTGVGVAVGVAELEGVAELDGVADGDGEGVPN